ncbi:MULTISPECIES: helix-turn-helix domain-containing protein [unclassified Lactobacillus]|uniref:helix-turn-helix domain-containing protein n=1 Tax=unclassified Lactobacillus TaxID=2620435 RepID=UPI0013140FC0|nr:MULTISPECIES: Rgg/GadR/MutR family transcriptional regulator [unclassified Lactobacillus]
MNNFGNSLRNIREAKGITIKQAAKNIVTPAFLSKFERGESEISFSKLLKILDHMNVDINEFILETNDFEEHPQRKFLKKLVDAANNKSITIFDNLEKNEALLYTKDDNLRHKHNILLCHLYKSEITNTPPEKNDWMPIKNYLMGVEDWAYYEFLLYANSLYFLPTEIIELVSKSAYQKGMRYLSLNDNKNGLTDTLLNTIETLINRNETSLVIPYIQLCETLLKSPDLMFERVRLMFYKGALKYLTGNYEFGLNQMDEAIKIIQTTGFSGSDIKNFEDFKNIISK